MADTQVPVAADVQKLLNQMRTRWEEAKKDPRVTSDGFTTLPDGRYMMKLNEATLGVSQNSGRLQITWVYTVMEGEKTGEFHRIYDGLDVSGTYDPLPYVLRTIRRMGLDVDQLEIDEVPAALMAITKMHPVVKTRLYHKVKDGVISDFQNSIIEQVYGPEGMLNEDPDATVSTPDATTTVVDDNTGPTLRIQDKVKFILDDGTDKVGLIKMFKAPELVVIMSGGKSYERIVDEISLYEAPTS